MHPDYVTEQESQKRGRAARLTLPVRPPGGGGHRREAELRYE